MAAQLADKPSFVIKPAQGSGGKGILVVTGRADGLFVKSSGLVIDEREIQKHTSNILAGLYSLGGRNDSAMVEALIDFDPRLQDYSVEGVPDIRIIVFRGVPVMAMMRCATPCFGWQSQSAPRSCGSGSGYWHWAKFACSDYP